jgi:hypothetical protein
MFRRGLATSELRAALFTKGLAALGPVLAELDTQQLISSNCACFRRAFIQRG